MPAIAIVFLSLLVIYSTVNCSTSQSPSKVPSTRPNPTCAPTTQLKSLQSSPSMKPSVPPTISPTKLPSVSPTTKLSSSPSAKPFSSLKPSSAPTPVPSQLPSRRPTTNLPSSKPITSFPTTKPTVISTPNPTVKSTSSVPTSKPKSSIPTTIPTKTSIPTTTPSKSSSAKPTAKPSASYPTQTPTKTPTSKPTVTPTSKTTRTPTSTPTNTFTAEPTASVLKTFNMFTARHNVKFFNETHREDAFHTFSANLQVASVLSNRDFECGITKFAHLTTDEYRSATGIDAFGAFLQEFGKPTARSTATPSSRPTKVTAVPSMKPGKYPSRGPTRTPSKKPGIAVRHAAARTVRSPSKAPHPPSKTPHPPTNVYRVGDGKMFTFTDDQSNSYYNGATPNSDPASEPSSSYYGYQYTPTANYYSYSSPSSSYYQYQPSTNSQPSSSYYQPSSSYYQPASSPNVPPQLPPSKPQAPVSPPNKPRTPIAPTPPPRTPIAPTPPPRTPVPPPVQPTVQRRPTVAVTKAPISSPTASVDWSSPTALPIGPAITPIKDQGQCGSCWAFASVGAIEGAYAIKNGQLKSFAEQQLVSCDKSEGGCNGGWPAAAMEWVGTVGGLALGADYPYTASAGTCKTNVAKDAKAKTAKSVQVGNNFAAMKAALNIGPVTVTVAASSQVWQMYTKGVLSSSACGNSVDHAILAVGYGVDAATGKSYIKCKNSWGNSWGENGYVRIWADDAANICSIYSNSYYPVLQ